MTFSVGDTVVYPHHGAALIESIEMREIGGQERKYLVLRVAQGISPYGCRRTTSIWLVCAMSSTKGPRPGLRGVAPAVHRGADQLVAPLQGEPRKLASGDVIKVAGWCATCGAAIKIAAFPPVKAHAEQGSQILVSELALAEHKDEDEAEVILDEVLAS